MSEPPDPTEPEFTLFEAEERVIEEAEAMIARLEEVAGGVRRLVEAYRHSYREQRRLVRLSDRMQLELHTAKQHLQEQADALQRTNQELQGEIESRRQLSEELHRLATEDALTGTANRRYFFELAAIAAERAAAGGAPLSVLMLDLDLFKAVNDTHGHNAGDAALAHFAGICRRELRPDDVLGRIGGEEFGCLLPDTGLGEALRLAERIRQRLEGEPLRQGDRLIPLTTSIGTAQFEPEWDRLIERALSRADQALYEAKRAGRNRVVDHPASKVTGGRG